MTELERKICEEIEKSGFPLEMYCKRKLGERQWRIDGPTYVHLDDGMTELDVVGSTQKDFKGNLSIFFTIHIECKKCANNHWVFFEEESTPYEIPVGSHYIDKVSLDARKIASLSVTQRKEIPNAKSYMMGLRSERNQIWQAIFGLFSSYRFHREFYGRHRHERKPDFNIIDVDFLTIVLDGKLFLARTDADGKVSVREVPRVVQSHHEIKWPRHNYYGIDIVTKDHFGAYLQEIDKNVSEITELVESEILQSEKP